MPKRDHAAASTVVGTSEAEMPAALRLALGEAARAMFDVGAGPADVLAMRWSARVPAMIHPAQVHVDLLVREIFGGMQPVISVRAGDHDGVRIEMSMRAPQPPDPRPVWNGFSAAELARAYSTRATVPNMAGIFEGWRSNGAAFRARNLAAELVYGRLPAQTIDLYLPRRTTGPVPLWIFIHGGYWQAIDKADNAQFAAGMLGAGYAVAMPNYTLAPAASLDDIVREMQAAVAFLAAEAAALGCDPAAIHIAGHSAGGHLAAMIAALPEASLVRSCLALSGLFDLLPLSRLPMGGMLRFDDDATVARLSPDRLRPHDHIRVGVAVGGLESREFQRQSSAFAARWGNAPCHIIAGRHHFDLLDGLNGGDLLAFARQLAARGVAGE